MAVTTHSRAFNYDVFLSFRGSDTRYGFTGHLYKALRDKGIQTFFDDEKLRGGEEITTTLVKAIEGSRIAITVLSEDYASSSFCLDELATILQCKTKGLLLVIPVFYKVDPSDVRHMKGSYGKSLKKHEKRFKAKNENMDKLQKWKMALRQVADFSGFHFKDDGDEYEYKFIEGIVQEVYREISLASRLHVADYPIGLESRVQEVMELFDVGSDDGVRMIGILGMGGIGKSTLARAVYNHLIVENFDGLCFLEDVREISNNQGGLPHLQSNLLSEILKEKDIHLTSKNQGISMIKSRLKGKKILLVLDDVDKLDQLHAIIGEGDWLGPRSKIIITTRDKQLLESHQVNGIYEMNGLNKNDALRLLTWKAFKNEKVNPMYEGVLHHVVSYCSGLPLALEVIGSSLYRKSTKEWEDAIDVYKRILDKDILKILKVSFDALEEEQKRFFLDIACCCKGYQLQKVKNILGARYHDSTDYHIRMLAEKSLLKIAYSHTHGGEDFVTYHDLIEDMARQIESSREPGERKRLWSVKDIKQVLKDNTETNKIEIICLNFLKEGYGDETIEWNGKAFENMKNLQILVIFSTGMVTLRSSIVMLPELSIFNAVKCMGWQWLKSEDGEENVGEVVSSKLDYFVAYQCNLCNDFFSTGFMQLAHVRILDLGKNNFTFLPECIKEFKFLIDLYVNECEDLQEIGGLPPNLKRLSARNCKSLSPSSSSMLLNKELHKARNIISFSFPGTNIPEWFDEQWFDEQSRRHSNSFWFRNKFPAKVLCILIAHSSKTDVKFMMFINGKVHQDIHWSSFELDSLELDHTYLFDLNWNLKIEVPLEKEWNHVEIRYECTSAKLPVRAVGIHVFKQESDMDDIQFTNPYKKVKASV